MISCTSRACISIFGPPHFFRAQFYIYAVPARIAGSINNSIILLDLI